ncbi:hypothetical protein HG531_013664 [Fusarium graminearum]|nr:hypothetical protein HG531_013664 [Fusarium graminearum]
MSASNINQKNTLVKAFGLDIDLGYQALLVPFKINHATSTYSQPFNISRAPLRRNGWSQNHRSLTLRAMRQRYVNGKHTQDSATKSKIGINLERGIPSRIHAESVTNKVLFNSIAEMIVGLFCVIQTSPTGTSPDLGPARIGIFCVAHST